MAKVVNANTTGNSTELNQTAQQAAEKAAETGLLNDPIFIGTIIAAVIIGIIAIAASRYSSKDEKLFKGKTLGERLKEKQISPAVEFGGATRKKVDYGLSELGVLEKWYKTSEVTEEDLLNDIHNQEPEKPEDIDEKDWDKGADLSDGQFKNVTMIVGPTSRLDRLKMKVKSNDPTKNDYLSIYSVPKTSVNNGDRVVIDDEKVDWNFSGGIYYSKDVQGMTTMYNFAALSLIDDLAEVFADKGDITQALNEQHVEWKSKKETENQAFIDYMKAKEDIDADNATD